MSDTPRTDELARELSRYKNDAHKVIDLLALAQWLERELAEKSQLLSEEIQRRERAERLLGQWEAWATEVGDDIPMPEVRT